MHLTSPIPSEPGRRKVVRVREGGLVSRYLSLRGASRARACVATAVGLAALGVVFGTGPTSPAYADDEARIICRWTDPRLDEVSGIALSGVHRRIAWVHNDSGGGPYLYALDTTTCVVRARIRISNIGARDIEGMAAGLDARGRHVLWVGDVGDNRDSWPSVRIHAVAEPLVLRDQSLPAATYRFTYRDGPFNAETVLALPARPRLWVVTKQLAQGGIYPLPDPLSARGVSKLVRAGATQGLVTDGAMSPTGTRYVLRDYLWAYVFDGRPPGRQVARITLPTQPQGEAITWAADGRGLLTAGERDNALWYVPLPGELQPADAGSASSSDSSPVATNSAESPTGPSSVLVVLLTGAAAVILVGLATRWLRR